MKFETVQIGNAHYGMKNSVMGTSFAAKMDSGKWGIFVPYLLEPLTATLEEALDFVASRIDTWYTTAQAAEVLVEMGAFDAAPSTHDICLWARNGLLPGAIKVTGKGSEGGRGGAWRVPRAALLKFAKRRRQ